ncbi:MAG: XRE family transcriptional regulator [Planctomycetota bacterium]
MPSDASPLGQRIRDARQGLGLTLDEVAGRTGISKPYLSLIETGRVSNPPSTEKLEALERALGLPPRVLVHHAELMRTPPHVRSVLAKLLKAGENDEGLDLDAAYLDGLLHDAAESTGNVGEPVELQRGVPIINKVAAGYPHDFTDLDYPPRVADDYLAVPGLNDPDAFATRVHGDSMQPKYNEGDIVVFSPALAPRPGDDCFVRFADGTTTFKRVFPEDDAVRLQPRNEKYRSQTIAMGEVAGIYRAVYRFERVDK